jgi:hypothetical protein
MRGCTIKYFSPGQVRVSELRPLSLDALPGYGAHRLVVKLLAESPRASDAGGGFGGAKPKSDWPLANKVLGPRGYFITAIAHPRRIRCTLTACRAVPQCCLHSRQ